MDDDGFEFDFDKEETSGNQVITPAMMRKRVIWDVAPDEYAVAVARRLGLNPASPDVEDMEKAEAYRRLQPVGILAPVLNDLALHSAEAVRAAMMEVHGDDYGDSPSMEIEVLAAFIAQSSAGILAELIDIGALHLPHYTILGGNIE